MGNLTAGSYMITALFLWINLILTCKMELKKKLLEIGQHTFIVKQEEERGWDARNVNEKK